MDIRAYIKQNEGLKDSLYFDSEDIPTIGYGHNLTVPIPQAAIEAIFEDDFMTATRQVGRFVSIKEENLYRWVALVDMMFNLGPTRFATFEKMITAIKAEDWEKAADEALDSKWAKQVGDRAVRDAYMLRYNKPWDEAKGE